jgi:hypothetical protein
MYLAIEGMFRPRWSAAVQDEWIRALLTDRPNINPRRIARTRALMDAHILDANVSGYETLIPTLVLPDPHDRHVLAAAIHGGASVIVTRNLRHFPATALEPHEIEASDPDTFICDLIEGDPRTALSAFAIDRAAMTSPAMTRDEYLAALDHAGFLTQPRRFAPTAMSCELHPGRFLGSSDLAWERSSMRGRKGTSMAHCADGNDSIYPPCARL